MKTAENMVTASDGARLLVCVFSPPDDHCWAARTLLFVNPVGIAAFAYTDLFERLVAKGFTIVSTEARNALTPVDRHEVDLSLERHAADIFEIWRSMIGRPFQLAGHCLGALIAAHAVDVFQRANAASAITQFVSVNGALRLDAGVSEYEKTLADLVGKFRTRPRLLEVIYPHARNAMVDSFQSEHHLRHFRALDDLAHFTRYIRSLAALYDSAHRLNEAAPKPQIPCHVLWSDEDRLLSPRQARLLGELFPRAEVSHCEKAGHYLPIEAGTPGQSRLIQILEAGQAVAS